MAMLEDLKGKVAVVTGGAQGIGKGVASTLLALGMKALVADVDQEACAACEEEFRLPGRIRFVKADVSDEASVVSLAETALELFGKVDAVVNNAGISGCFGIPLEKLTLEQWSRVIGCNLTSCFLMAKHFTPVLKSSPGGAIVNIASTRALMSEPHTEAYSASKGGIVALTHAMAVSLGPSIRVNCVSPGWIETCQFKKPSLRSEPEHSELDKSQHPCGRVGAPEDVASLVAFLISESSGFISGQNFVCDGGMTKKMIYA